MKFWHPFIIRKLKRPQLVELFNSVCKMRSEYGTESKRNLPEHVIMGSYEQLCAYYMLVVRELKNRDIQYDRKWDDLGYRGEIERNVNGNKVMVPVARIVINKEELKHFIEIGNPYPAWCTSDRYSKQLAILQKTKGGRKK